MKQRHQHWIFCAALAVGFCGYELAVGVATAEADDKRLEAKRAADVYATPGEQSRVVTRVRAGKVLVVLQRKGRWIKVRVSGKTGWITRSNTASLELSEPAPRKKRARAFVKGRSKERGFRQRRAPSDRVGAEVTDKEMFLDDEDEGDARSRRERRRAAKLRRRAQAREMGRDIEDEPLEEEEDDFDDEEVADEDPLAQEPADEPEEDTVLVKVAEAELHERRSTRSDTVSVAAKGARLYVIEREGDWIMVETEDGDSGWVRAKSVGDDDGPGYQYEKFAKSASASLGYAAMGQSFASNGTDQANYSLGSALAVISLGGDVLYDYSKKYLIGGDIRYRLGYASPGIRFVDPNTADAVDIGFKTHTIDLGARGGYKLSKKNGMAAFGRLGYHYERFGINNVENFEQNLARLPSEILQGVTIGASLEVPRLTKKLSGQVGIDALALFASRKQTVGLEDGDVSKTFALWGAALVEYLWKPNMVIRGGYQYSYAKTSWAGAAEGSMRPHQATSAQRTDGTHLITVGLGRSF